MTSIEESILVGSFVLSWKSPELADMFFKV